MQIDLIEKDNTRIVLDTAQITSYEYRNGPASGHGDGVSSLTVHMTNGKFLTFRDNAADELETKLYHEKFPQEGV